MAPNTRNKEKPTSGARASEKKKAHHAKHAPTIDPLKQAAERLRITHIYATATSTSPRYDKKCKKFLEEYISSLHDLREQLGADLLELVPDMYAGTVPKLVLLMGGSTTLDKKRIVGYRTYQVVGKKLRPRNLWHWGLKKVMITRWGGYLNLVAQAFFLAA